MYDWIWSELLFPFPFRYRQRHALCANFQPVPFKLVCSSYRSSLDFDSWFSVQYSLCWYVFSWTIWGPLIFNFNFCHLYRYSLKHPFWFRFFCSLIFSADESYAISRYITYRWVHKLYRCWWTIFQISLQMQISIFLSFSFYSHHALLLHSTHQR